MNNGSILLVEDDAELAELIAEYLRNKQHSVTVISEGISAVDHIVNEQPDLVILDLMLPGKDGISICREARFGYKGPILMLTASDDAVDQILGLEIRADDFVQKPVEPRILLARIRALLRRVEDRRAEDRRVEEHRVEGRRVEGQRPESTPQHLQTSKSHAEVLQFQQLSINLSARSVTFQGNPVTLTTPEFEVLAVLARNAGSVQSRDDLFKQLKNLE